MSKNSVMANVKASQEWAEWMDQKHPDRVRRRQKPKTQSYVDYLEDDDLDYGF
jgi:hypothetical protein